MNRPNVTDRLAFVVCTERGTLAKKTLVLVRTLRELGGRYAECPVFSYSPREGRQPRRETLRRLAELGVETILEPLNREFSDYGFGNKVVACAHAEEELSHDRFVFLDSDILVFREPAELWSAEGNTVKLRPVSRKLAGSTGSDENAAYWKEILEWAGVGEPAFIETAVTGERVYGYWNAGVISAPGKAGFYRGWLETLRGLVRDGLMPPSGMTFLDQIALSLTAHRPPYRVEELPRGYNFPVNTLVGPPDESPWPSDPPDPDDIVLAHYHKVFDRYPIRDPVSRFAPADRRKRIRRIVRRSGLVGFGSWLRHRLHYRLGWDFLAP